MHAAAQARGVAAVPESTVTVLDVSKTRASSPPGEFFEQLMKMAGFANRVELALVSGVDPGTLGRWIRGETRPTLDKLSAVAPHLKVRPGDLAVAFGLTTSENLGMIGPPPAPPLPDIVREIIERLAAPQTPRRRQALINHLFYSLELFDEVEAQVNNSPREPRMRRR